MFQYEYPDKAIDMSEVEKWKDESISLAERQESWRIQMRSLLERGQYNAVHDCWLLGEHLVDSEKGYDDGTGMDVS